LYRHNFPVDVPGQPFPHYRVGKTIGTVQFGNGNLRKINAAVTTTFFTAAHNILLQYNRAFPKLPFSGTALPVFIYILANSMPGWEKNRQTPRIPVFLEVLAGFPELSAAPLPEIANFLPPGKGLFYFPFQKTTKM
jgi:hypothetical protein